MDATLLAQPPTWARSTEVVLFLYLSCSRRLPAARVMSPLARFIHNVCYI
jgi:hypothetical protein